MYCSKCGKQLPNDARFCRSCGAPVPQKTNTHRAPPTQTNKVGSQNTRNVGGEPNKKRSFLVIIGVVLALILLSVVVSALMTRRLTIGQSYQGGKIAYLLVSGDPGYDSNVQHGLIAATADQSTGTIWAAAAYQNTSVPGTLTTIGSGAANTAKIIDQNGAGTTYAAGLARAYTGGGYSDWYLPSKDELNQLYLNQTAVGGFASAYYWSSSESYNLYACVQTFDDGNQYNAGKFNTTYVRAVRAF